MPHNVTATNEGGNANVQSACRPIYTEFTHSGSSPTSAMLLAQVEVYQGTNVVPVGNPLVITRNPASSALSPLYTFDISSILKSYIKSGDHIDHSSDSIFSQSSAASIALFPSTTTTVAVSYTHLTLPTKA